MLRLENVDVLTPPEQATATVMRDHHGRDMSQVAQLDDFVVDQIRDAYYVATHKAVRDDGLVRIAAAPDAAAPDTRFMVLYEGRIYFEGTATALLASRDAFVREFLFMTLPPW